MGLSLTQDHTVDYYIYCKLTGTGLISGETLTAEIPLTKFDTLAYDYGSEGTNTFTPTDDAKVTSLGDYNYGSSDNLRARYFSSDGTKDPSFLKFDISTIPSGAFIDSAILKLYCTYRVSTTSVVYCYSVTDDSWSEDTLVWSNKPAEVDLLDQVTLSTTGWKSWDVTSFVQDQVGSGDYIISLKIRTDYTDGDAGGNFNSKEADSNHPALEITYIDWSASWSWFNLPLSVVSLPIGQQFLAAVFMVLAFAVWAAAREKARRRRRRK